MPKGSLQNYHEVPQGILWYGCQKALCRIITRSLKEYFGTDAKRLSAELSRGPSRNTLVRMPKGSLQNYHEVPQGILWYGCQKALCRIITRSLKEYFGTDAKRLSAELSRGPSRNTLVRMPKGSLQNYHEVPQGILWYGCQKALCRIITRSLKEYFGTDAKRLSAELSRGPSRNTLVRMPKGSLQNYHEVPQGILWYGCQKALCRILLT